MHEQQATPLGTIIRGSRWPPAPLRRGTSERWPTSVAKMPVRVVRWIARVLSALRGVRNLRRLYRAELKHCDAANASRGADSAFGVERCDIRYINLDRRGDRKAEFELEMHKLGITWHKRISAIPMTNGLLGCTLSHIMALRQWEASGSKLLLVCEDDAQFVVNRPTLDALIEEFATSPELSVVALAYRTAWLVPISPILAMSSDIQTTAAYIVKPAHVAELISIFEESVSRLNSPKPKRSAALDKVWKNLQRRRVFAIPHKPYAIQRPSYSDIIGAKASYSNG